KIVFVSTRDGNEEIYTMNVNGSNQTRLTNNIAFDYSPSFSPDGSKIVFYSDRSGLSKLDIYVMNANDGSNQQQLTSNSAVNAFPSFSPDGKQIAFASTRDSGKYQIYIMSADGLNQNRLTGNSANDLEPVFSPDGKKIAFYSDRDGNYEIYVMNT